MSVDLEEQLKRTRDHLSYGGGTAFPVVLQGVGGAYGETALISRGLSIRDYFAGLALPKAWEEECRCPTHSGAKGAPSYKGVAERAYLLADAMLAERNRGES